MANEHLILCGGAVLASRDRVWGNAPRQSFCLGSGRRQLHLNISHLTDKMCAHLPPVAADLVEVAAYVYAADQAVSRGGASQFDYGARWRRRFRFEIPVRQPDLWRRHDILAALEETLTFLCDDAGFEFGFCRQNDAPPITRYLYGEPADHDTDYEEVMLFSGGLDSLGGAVQEVLQGRRKVVLVSHRPVSKIYGLQRDLAGRLRDRVGSPRLHPLHVAVEVNKDKCLAKDFNQRSRSFLFASIAAVVARAFGLRLARFYENGVVSLNLPLSPQVIGGWASRTTHPRVLSGFSRLFTLLFGGDFRVDNPFQPKTRTQILREIKAAGHADLCADTVSCTHTWTRKADSPHCGRCTQCVDRRLAALAAGLTDGEDPPERYESSVLTDPREGPDLTVVERWVGTARRVRRMTRVGEFVAAFPEVSRVLRHLDTPAAEAAEQVFSLYRRHAGDVEDALVAAVRSEPVRMVRGELPETCLLRLACGQPGQRVPRQLPSQNPGLGKAPELVLDQETFEARLGDKGCFLGNSKEFHLLRRLNRRPGHYVSVAALREDVWEDPHVEKNAIQRVVSNLRRRLEEEGMTRVVIDGRQRDHYQLEVRP